ncbi:expressed unknown protein [Seminavis robusta]|uniref:Uncharacterized protein n=1 Tax=Seminavis robusta TaxID=568900 RepID=A0A9N8DFH3_9STRA|nr:expressed unknown protein [Seminavis robusta]|eukprot:Sro64_g036180.1 n/a (243) ;mRNA; r:33307-34282
MKDLAAPAPKVETVKVEPASHTEASEPLVEPALAVEPAYAEPAKCVERAETVDDPRKFAPANALNAMKEKSKIGVETLRQQGVDFEGRAGICRGGAPKKNFFKVVMPLFFDQRDYITFSEIARYLVIQGGCCFVFLESTDPSPLYAFSLHELTAEIENLDKPDKASFTVNPISNTNKQHPSLVNVLLRNYGKEKELEYQIVLDTEKDKGIVKRFLDVVQRNSAAVVEATVQPTSSSKGAIKK